MSDLNESRPGRGDGIDKVLGLIETVDQHHDGKASAAAKALLDSFHRICRTAEGMLSGDGRQPVTREQGTDGAVDAVLDTVGECETEYRRWHSQKDAGQEGVSPHPAGAIAEHLVARTIAAFGGADAVKSLEDWTLKTESRLASHPADAEDR